jgi:formate-dependent nitrite reductase membrane component NrfD
VAVKEAVTKPVLAPPPEPVPRWLRLSLLLPAAYVAAVHLALAQDRYEKDAHYVGAVFVAAALVLAVSACVAASGDRRWGTTMMWLAWTLAALASVLLFVGFVLSRTTGLPDYHHHDLPVIQVIALVAECAVVALSVAARAAASRAERA